MSPQKSRNKRSSDEPPVKLHIQPLDTTISNKYTQRQQYSDDSGLDIFIPHDVTIPAKATGFKVGLGFKACALYNNEEQPYMIFQRSSIAKAPFRLSNAPGLIDTWYRGELIVAFDNVSNEQYTIEAGTE